MDARVFFTLILCCAFSLLPPLVGASKQKSSEIILCNIAKPDQCKFGGSCSTLSLLQRLNAKVDPDQHFCKCENTSCSMGNFAPVCSENEITYFNDACRKTHECQMQAPIRPICKGVCGDPLCEAIHSDEESSLTT